MKKANVTKCAVIMAAIALTSCGGGGGGGDAGNTSVSTTPPSGPTPIPKPTASLLSITPATGARIVSNDGSGISVVFKLTVTNADTSDASKLSFLCNSKVTAFTATSPVASGVSTSTIIPTSNLALGERCTVSGDITTTGAGGSVKTPVSTSLSVVSSCVAPACVAGSVWTPSMNTWVAPKMVRASYFYQLPANCTQSTQQCFKDAIPHMSAVDSDGTNSTGDHTTWLLFRGSSSLQNVLPFYTKNGLRAYADITGGYTSEIDGVWGSAHGIIERQKSSQTCFEITVAGAGTPIACPLN